MNFGEATLKSTKKLSPMLSGSWLISFGDLLTLLLCFFLTIVSFGPLNPKAVLPKSNVTTQSHTQNSASAETWQNDQRSGTQVAESNNSQALNQEALRLIFRAEDFVELTEKVIPKKFSELQKLIKLDGYSLSRISLESCSDLESEDQGWSQALARGFALRSQLIDAGVGSEIIDLRVVGRHCAALVNNPTEAGLVLVVSIGRDTPNQKIG